MYCTTFLRFMSDRHLEGLLPVNDARRSGSPPDWQVNLTAIEHFRQTNPRDTGAEPSGMSRDLASTPGLNTITTPNITIDVSSLGSRDRRS